MFCARGPFVESPVLAPKTFRARKGIFSSSVSKNGEVYDLCNLSQVSRFRYGFPRAKTFQDLREKGPWGAFLERPEEFSGPQSSRVRWSSFSANFENKIHKCK